MTQRQQLHAVGALPVCPDCGDELRHILDDRTCGGHFLSCCCGDSPKFPAFDALYDAMVGWCAARHVHVPDTQLVCPVGSQTARLELLEAMP